MSYAIGHATTPRSHAMRTAGNPVTRPVLVEVERPPVTVEEQRTTAPSQDRLARVLSRAVAERPTLQRVKRLPAAGGAPKRVTSDGGGMVVVDRDTFYARASLVQTAKAALAARGSYITLDPGAPCPFDGALVRVEVAPAAGAGTGVQGSLKRRYFDVNQRDPVLREAARDERARAAGLNIEKTKAYGGDLDRFLADIKKNLTDYVTFSDCHNNTMLVLGSEYAGESAVFQPKGRRAELLSLPKADAEDFEGSPRKPTGRRIDDPATRGAYAWLAKAIPHFASVLENYALTLERRAMNGDRMARRQCIVNPQLRRLRDRIRNSVVSTRSIIDPATRASALKDPSYPRELWDIYNEIQRDGHAARLLAKTYSMNDAMKVRTGDAIAVINNPFEKQVVDQQIEAESRKPEAARKEIQTKWNYHWIPVVMTEGADYAVLENAAGDAPDPGTLDSYRWRFRLFGPGGTIHDANAPRVEPETTRHYMTLPFGKPAGIVDPVAPPPPQGIAGYPTIDVAARPYQITSLKTTGDSRTAAIDKLVIELQGKNRRASAEQVREYVNSLVPQ